MDIRLPDICISPMWKGVGILTKVIDMMAAGRPTVVSPLATDGIPELVHGQNCLIGKDPASFVQEVDQLLNDQALCDRIAEGGRELMIDHYSWASVGPQLKNYLDDQINSRPIQYLAYLLQKHPNRGRDMAQKARAIRSE